MAESENAERMSHAHGDGRRHRGLLGRGAVRTARRSTGASYNPSILPIRAR